MNHSRLGEALLTLDGPRLRALLVACNNPAVTCPTAAAVRRGLAREDLFDAHPHHLYIADDRLPGTAIASAHLSRGARGAAKGAACDAEHDRPGVTTNAHESRWCPRRAPGLWRIHRCALSARAGRAYVAAMAFGAGDYRPRDAEHAVLYQLIGEHLDAFLETARRHADGASLPAFVEQEFRDFLTCGVLAHGFARLRCTD